MKAIIIGSSIAGSSLAYYLADSGADVVVYESKQRKDVGKKVCANIYTLMIKDILKDLGINYRDFARTHYNNFKVYSKNNSAEFKTEEYEFDRAKLLEKLISNAERKGARFVFNTSFKDFYRKNSKFIVSLKGKKFLLMDSSDILIGADGALSEVAKKSGLWKRRKFFLDLQATIPRASMKNEKYLPAKDSYNLFLGKEFGYYSYVFSSKNGIVVGLADDKGKNVRKEFENFLRFLKIKNAKVEGALIPKPKAIMPKHNLFLVGDAGCQIKFSGGGVIPAFIAAKAVKEIIVRKDWKPYNKMISRVRFNTLATAFFNNLSDKRADNLIEISKDRRFADFLKYRDYLSKQDLKKIISAKLVLSAIKNLFL